MLSASQRQAEVTPEALKLVESARKIYRALGDYPERGAAVRAGAGADRGGQAAQRPAAGAGAGAGREAGRPGGGGPAAGRGGAPAAARRPGAGGAGRGLRQPGWLGADGKERAATIYYQIARRRHEAGDIDNAVAALRKALAAVPGHPRPPSCIEQVLYGAAPPGRPGSLLPGAGGRGPATLEEKMDFLFKRAQLAEGDRDDCRGGAAHLPGDRRRSSRRAARPRSAWSSCSPRKQDWARLAELREKQLPHIEAPEFRLAVLTELAQLYRDRLGDPEQAAVYWHAILKENPTHPEALEAYAEHFRQRGDWQSLVELLEFSFEHARGGGPPLGELLERLEEIAVISERNLSDSERALAAWQRMDELDARPRSGARGAEAHPAEGQAVGPHGGGAGARGQDRHRSRPEGRQPAAAGPGAAREAERHRPGGRRSTSRSWRWSPTIRWPCAR